MFDLFIRKGAGYKRAKVNTVAFKDEATPGLRLNYATVLKAVLLIVANSMYVTLNNHYPNVFAGWAYGGAVMLLVGVTIIGLLISWARQNDEWWPVLAAFFLGMIVLGLLIWLFGFEDVSWKAVVAGMASFVVLAVLLWLTGLTTWFPHQRETRNRT